MIWIQLSEANNQITDLNLDGKLPTAAKTIKKDSQLTGSSWRTGPVEGELPPFPCISFMYSSNMLDAILDSCGPACPQQNNWPAQCSGDQVELRRIYLERVQMLDLWFLNLGPRPDFTDLY